MALPVIENCTRVTWNFATYLGVTPRVVQHFLTATSDMQELGDNIWSNVADGIFGPMHQNFEPTSIALLPLDGTSATTIVDNPAPSDSNLCNADGQMLPAVAALMSWRTLVRGPKARGRSYIGPICEQTTSDGVLDDPWRSDLQSAWNDTLLALGGVTPSIALCVASYVHEEAYLVQSASAERPVATQRRRQQQLR